MKDRQSKPQIRGFLDEEKNGYVARDQSLYAIEELDSCQVSQIRHQREITWEQGPIRALVSITLHYITT